MTLKSLFIYFLLLGSCQLVMSQDVQWASSVIDFSSEFKSREYSANQVLGKPNKLPAWGSSEVAWSPKLPNGGEEFIKVAFSNPQEIQQLVVAESFNPGAIIKVFTYDERGKEYTVHAEMNPKPIGQNRRVFSITGPPSGYRVAAVKIVLNTRAVPGYNHIDAIGITSGLEPVFAKINLAGENFNEEPENLGDAINSRFAEVHPIISPDGQELFFTRKNHPQNMGPDKKDDIWVSFKNDAGQWVAAENVGTPLNSIGHNYINAISPDGKSTLIGGTYNNHAAKDRLFVSRKLRGSWTQPEELIIDDYYNLSQYNSFHMSVDNRTLIMSVEREECYGQKDIYVSFLEGLNQWSRPINIGSDVNTAGDETTPFLAADGKTLYFSSNGFSGYGSNDIFMSRRLDESWTRWSEPENLGPKINTENWDAYYSVPANAEFGYFTSYFNSKGSADIFRIRLNDAQKPEEVAFVQGKVLDEIGLVKRGSLNYTATDGSVGTIELEDGNFQLIFPKDVSVTFTAAIEGYGPIEQTFQIASAKEQIDIQLISTGATAASNVKMDFPVGEPITLENLQFSTSSIQLDASSYTELRRLSDYLKKYPMMKVQISGHTNNQCSPQYCVTLSTQRAQSVAQFLASEGVSSRQISYEGFGSAKPIASNETEDGRWQNQRVEFEILE